MPDRQTVEVWRNGKSTTLHKVEIDENDVSGIPHVKPITCDTCRIIIPRNEVDSLRLTSGDRNALLGTGLIVGFFVGAMLVWRAVEKD